VNLFSKINADTAALSEEIQGSLVRIANAKHGAGAGTVWHSEGLIVTNAHVLGRRGELKVTLPDGVEVPARVLAMDRKQDVAALAVEVGNLATIELGDSQKVKPGEWVMAFGHPWGIPGAATAGVVIGHGATLPERPAFGGDWLAVSLHYRPGHSGGPLVDAEGKLIGINTVMAGPDVGLAVPVHEIKRFLKTQII
jgi:S1-C subfamily serine protease